MKKIIGIIVLALIAALGGMAIARYLTLPAAVSETPSIQEHSPVPEPAATTTLPVGDTVTTTTSAPSSTPVATTTPPAPRPTPTTTPSPTPKPTPSPAPTPAPTPTPPTGPLPPAQNTTGLLLSIPDGFRLEIFAKNIGGARAMAFDADGNLWVTRGYSNAVTKIDIVNGAFAGSHDIFRGLTLPHGIAADPDNANILYIAEANKISRTDVSAAHPTLVKIADLPDDNVGHRTRTLGIGPDKRLYVSIGSSCDACREQNPMRGTIYTLNRDGSDMHEFARGMRNPVFFTWNPNTHYLWAIDMGRDHLGDNLPPDELNIIGAGEDYGWPICYGNNVHDTVFDKNVYVRDPCADKIPATVELPAHVAPLGLAFIPHSWPEEYWDDILVAEHGSSERSSQVGYKIIRVKMNAHEDIFGTADFITGWAHGTRPENAYGRPVGILMAPDGTAYISDDSKGNIYRLSLIR